MEVRVAQEMEGLEALAESLGGMGGRGSGFPWLAILRPDGSLVMDSTDPNRGNIGSPQAEWEIPHWNAMMRTSVEGISEEEIEYMATTWAEDRRGH